MVKPLKELIYGLQLWCVYHSCKTTPLYVFIEVSDGNIKAVKKRLFPSKQTLEMGAGMLQTEFTSLCGEAANAFPQKRALKLRLMIVQLQELFNIHSKSKKHRAKIEKKILNMTNSKTLEMAKKMLESWEYQAKIEEEKLKKANDKNKTIETTFEDLIVEVERHNKFQIDRKKTTAAQFARYVKSFKRQIENQNKANGKRKGLK